MPGAQVSVTCGGGGEVGGAPLAAAGRLGYIGVTFPCTEEDDDDNMLHDLQVSVEEVTLKYS